MTTITIPQIISAIKDFDWALRVEEDICTEGTNFTVKLLNSQVYVHFTIDAQAIVSYDPGDYYHPPYSELEKVDYYGLDDLEIELPYDMEPTDNELDTLHKWAETFIHEELHRRLG